MSLQANIDALRNSPLFAAVREEDLAEIGRRAKIRQYFANDMIVYQGEPSTALFVIVNGIVAVKSVVRGRENILAYLMPGNTFGEVGILENQTRSASVSALSEVEVLVLQREDFVDILQRQPGVAIELARLLGRYLVQSSRRLSSENAETRLILFISTESGLGATSVGTLLAERLVSQLRVSTAYLEYPNPWRALHGYPLQRGADKYHHAEGYDLLFPQEEAYLSTHSRATLLLDRLQGSYDIIIVHLNQTGTELYRQLAEQASQVILMAPADEQGLREFEVLLRQIRQSIRPDETSLISMLQGDTPEVPPVPPGGADFFFPRFEAFPSFGIPSRKYSETPPLLAEALDQCVQRLERNQSLSIFIPTTVNAQQSADTRPQRDRAVEFLAERFGGATVREVEGVWKSERLGLIGERIFEVYSYITRAELSKYLDEVIEFMKHLKRELRQEAMALEINQRFTLI
jgi:CRP-like cAMP-binding protein